MRESPSCWGDARQSAGAVTAPLVHRERNAGAGVARAPHGKAPQHERARAMRTIPARHAAARQAAHVRTVVCAQLVAEVPPHGRWRQLATRRVARATADAAPWRCVLDPTLRHGAAVSKTFTSATHASTPSHAAAPFVPARQRPSPFARAAQAAAILRLPATLSRSLDDVEIRQSTRVGSLLPMMISRTAHDTVQRRPASKTPASKPPKDERSSMEQDEGSSMERRREKLIPIFDMLAGLSKMSKEERAAALKASEVDEYEVSSFIRGVKALPKKYKTRPQQGHRNLLEKLEEQVESMNRFIDEASKYPSAINAAEHGKKWRAFKTKRSKAEGRGPGVGPDEAEGKRLKKKRKNKKAAISAAELEKQPGQQNLWVNSGSGRLPRV
jgi:hypothetical protein